MFFAKFLFLLAFVCWAFASWLLGGRFCNRWWTLPSGHGNTSCYFSCRKKIWKNKINLHTTGDVSLPIIDNLHISLSLVLPADPGQPVPLGFLLQKDRAGLGQARALAWPDHVGHQVCETDEHSQAGQKEAHSQAPGCWRDHSHSSQDSLCICGQLALMIPIIPQV